MNTSSLAPISWPSTSCMNNNVQSPNPPPTYLINTLIDIGGKFTPISFNLKRRNLNWTCIFTHFLSTHNCFLKISKSLILFDCYMYKNHSKSFQCWSTLNSLWYHVVKFLLAIYTSRHCTWWYTCIPYYKTPHVKTKHI